jgi:hypothetical protein
MVRVAGGGWRVLTAPRKITGYAITKRDGLRHGLRQAMDRDGGRGVSPAAMLEYGAAPSGSG